MNGLGSVGLGGLRRCAGWWVPWALAALVAGLLGAGLSPATAVPTGNVVVDPTWRPTGGVASLVAASLVQPDGKLVVVGPFSSVNGVRRVTIVRLNPDGTLDPSFDSGGGFDAPVRDLALQPDGKIIAAGVFTAVNGVQRPLVARLLPDGQVDPTFDAPVVPAAVTPSAAAGRSTRTDSWRGGSAMEQFRSGSAATDPAAIRSAAAVAPATGPPSVSGVEVQADGTLIVYGQNLPFDGSMNMVLGRLSSDGSLDPTFQAPWSGAGVGIGDVVAQPDGTVVVGGYNFQTAQPILARLAGTGALDPTWVSSQCNAAVWDLLRLDDGRLLASGGFTGCGGPGQRGMVRLLASGAVDPTFDTGAGFTRDGEPVGPDDVTVLSDGRLAVVGYFTGVNGAALPGVAVLGPNGALDGSFQPPAPGGPVASAPGPYVWEVQPQSEGRLLIVGVFGSVGGSPRTGLARLGPDGSLDPGYAPRLYQGVGVDSWTSDALLQPDGKLVVAGGFGSYNSEPARALVRVNPNGTRDASFSTDGTGLAFVDAMVRQPDGRYIVAGAVVVSPTAVVLAVIRLNPNGSRDPSFAAQRYDLAQDQQIVTTMALQPDGKVLVAGQFTGPGGRANLMRLGSNGTPDASFSIGSGFTHPALGLLGIWALIVQADGRIVAGGGFTAVNGVPRSGIVRLQPTGAVDPSFNPGAGFTGVQAQVRALALAPGGRLWAAGKFSAYNGQPRQAIARLNGNGSLDASFSPAGQFLQPYLPTEVTLTSVLGQTDGRVIVTGTFVTFNGVARPGMLRLTAAGALDATFDPGSGFAQSDYISRLIGQPDGAIVLVGPFAGFNDTSPTPLGLTRLVHVAAAPSAPTAVSVTNGDGAVLVSATPPATAGGGWAQRYEFSADNGNTWPVTADVPTATLSGLVNGQVYKIRVRAANQVGTGPASVAVDGKPVAPTASEFVRLTPARVADSRVAVGGVGPILEGTTRVVSLATALDGNPVVPEGAVAVAYNLTIPTPGAAGHVRVMPGDAVGLTAVSTINFRIGETIANAAVVKVPTDRSVKVYAAATTDVIIDVVGYFVPTGAGVADADQVTPANGVAGRFTAVTPVRVYDASADPQGLLAGGTSRVVSAATTQGGATAVVPAGASAVAYNVTVVGTTTAGHLRIMPGYVAATPTSAINWSTAGERIANGSVVGVDGDRQIRVFNGSDAPVRFLIDVVGYYSAAGAQFYPIDPVRTTETRVACGGAGPVAPLAPGVRAFSVSSSQAGAMPSVPDGAIAVAYNATVVATGSVGHLRLFPASVPIVDASVLNWPGAGYTRANASSVAVSPTREVKAYNGAGTSTDVLIDINGYYK